MGFSRQEYWSRLPCPPPGALLDPGIEPTAFTSPALAGGFFTSSTTWEAHVSYTSIGKKSVANHTKGKTEMKPAPGQLGGQTEVRAEGRLFQWSRQD